MFLASKDNILYFKIRLSFKLLLLSVISISFFNNLIFDFKSLCNFSIRLTLISFGLYFSEA